MDSTQTPSDGSKNGFSLVITLLSMTITLLLCLVYTAEVKNPCSYTRAENGGIEWHVPQCESGLENDNRDHVVVNQPATSDLKNSGQ